MKTPKFTDADKYKVPYRNSADTDIRKRFRKIREEQKRQQEATAAKVKQFKVAAK